jgi:hypothetical protein
MHERPWSRRLRFSREVQNGLGALKVTRPGVIKAAQVSRNAILALAQIEAA